jgi:hypothetical protein
MPADDGQGGFIPLGLQFLKRTGEAPQIQGLITTDEAAIKKQHESIRKLLGTRKQYALGIPDQTKPPLISVGDNFLNLVVDGKIQVVHGRLASITNKSDDGQDNNSNLILCPGAIVVFPAHIIGVTTVAIFGYRYLAYVEIRPGRSIFTFVFVLRFASS